MTAIDESRVCIDPVIRVGDDPVCRHVDISAIGHNTDKLILRSVHGRIAKAGRQEWVVETHGIFTDLVFIAYDDTIVIFIPYLPIQSIAREKRDARTAGEGCLQAIEFRHRRILLVSYEHD